MDSDLDNCVKLIEGRMLNNDDSLTIRDLLFDSLEFGYHGIDWSKYSNSTEIENIKEFDLVLSESKCYIVWDEYGLPVVESNFNKVVQNLDDVTVLSFDTWLISLNFNWVLEFHHEGKIRYTKL